MAADGEMGIPLFSVVGGVSWKKGEVAEGRAVYGGLVVRAYETPITDFNGKERRSVKPTFIKRVYQCQEPIIRGAEKRGDRGSPLGGGVGIFEVGEPRPKSQGGGEGELKQVSLFMVRGGENPSLAKKGSGFPLHAKKEEYTGGVSHRCDNERKHYVVVKYR